jgi:hypothetical protein
MPHKRIKIKLEFKGFQPGTLFVRIEIYSKAFFLGASLASSRCLMLLLQKLSWISTVVNVILLMIRFEFEEVIVTR